MPASDEMFECWLAGANAKVIADQLVEGPYHRLSLAEWWMQAPFPPEITEEVKKEWKRDLENDRAAAVHAIEGTVQQIEKSGKCYPKYVGSLIAGLAAEATEFIEGTSPRLLARNPISAARDPLEEISRLISGGKVSGAALEHAVYRGDVSQEDLDQMLSMHAISAGERRKLREFRAAGAFKERQRLL